MADKSRQHVVIIIPVYQTFIISCFICFVLPTGILFFGFIKCFIGTVFLQFSFSISKFQDRRSPQLKERGCDNVLLDSWYHMVKDKCRVMMEYWSDGFWLSKMWKMKDSTELYQMFVEMVQWVLYEWYKWFKDRAEISSGNEDVGQADVSGGDLSRVVRNDCQKELPDQLWREALLFWLGTEIPQ